jgi:isoleucyl-tRNA synthetase
MLRYGRYYLRLFMNEGRPEFTKMEEEILEFWEKNSIFKKTLEKESPKGEFVFYEGPPTANGKPGIHHLEARAFKDVIPRYRTMRGYHVRRKGGWDTHGLPVEIEVEKQLGLKTKKEVEGYGVEKFNEKCKESVWKYLEDWQKFTRRIGFWVDLEDPYITYKPAYVESLWAIVKKIWDDGRLYRDYKVVPWCPRCGTGLSSHELAQGYKDVRELSVTVKFKVKNPSAHGLSENLYLLAWTTTPWTLPGNVGLAVGEKINYVVFKVKGASELLLAASDRLGDIVKNQEIEIVRDGIKGSDLIGLEYEPLYPFMMELVTGEEKEKLERNAYKVYPADFVTTEDGTGIVHTAVMYGQDDFVLGNDVGLPKFHLVNLDGTFIEGTSFLAGRFVKEEGLDVEIIKDLASRGLLFDKFKYEHTYPFCWRCKTPLIYYARDSWYVRMSDLREKMIAENKEINWEPSHIRDGRFGEWLDGVKDWAISRERYWATPLPIWESESGERICVGSFEELRSLAKNPSKVGENFDPHRPFVDEIVIEKDGKEYHRIPEVIDVWFDSGAMPFAQDHFPFFSKNGEPIGGYPADFISEAIDQTRGWFYTLHAVGALMGKGKSYKNVICLGHILDAEGKKMSKSVGNIVDPWEMIEKYGVDALRWWMYTVNQPGESKNFDEKNVDDIVKKVFMILLNVKSFYEMYVDSTTHHSLPTTTSHHVLDQWILARLDELITDATKWLDSYRVLEPARAVGDFITDLSQWYVRRSRDRFKGDDKADKAVAIATLRRVLLKLSKLMAPFAPFLAEKLYRDLGGEKESVHLEDWPVATPLLGKAVRSSEESSGSRREEQGAILADMKLARDIVTLALERRAKEKLPVRQPLASLTVLMQGKLSDELKAIIADEVNVKKVEIGSQKLEVGISVELDTNITPTLKAEGQARELIRRVNDLRKTKGLQMGEDARLTIGIKSDTLRCSIEAHLEEIKRSTSMSKIIVSEDVTGESSKIGEEELILSIN